MKIRSTRRHAAITSVIAAAITACLVAPVTAATHSQSQKAAPHFQPVQVSPTVPSDIPGGAGNASLSQAAIFAWEEFIALNWPAVTQNGAPGTRDTPDTSKYFGDPSYTGPLAWHTYRNKVEIFPGAGLPAGTTANSGMNPPYQCNYDAAPQYNYASTATTHVAPSGPNPPWINADENSQIGLDHIFAGVANGTAMPLNNEILFLAKGNRVDFDYVCPKGWWSTKTSGPYTTATKAYIQQHGKDPTPGSSTLVSFPFGTIELKAAWRRLGASEDASRFYTTKVRYYATNTANGVTQIVPVDETLALVGLHIIQKTPSAPYFIFATFEQTDNILDASGQPVEDANGTLLKPAASPLTPAIESVNATAKAGQSFKYTEGEFGDAGPQLNYANVPNSGLVTGTIKVNTRKHAIPQDIITVNQEAHQAIATYIAAHFPAGTKTPWAYYKLVNVQAKPIDKPVPGQTYTRADAATYYQANSTIETDYDLQVFSGQFYPYGGSLAEGEGGTLVNTITDFNPDGSAFKNVAHAGHTFNMGGCMGCHGNAQHGGADFSFILAGGRDTTPDTAGTVEPVLLNKVVRYLKKTK